MKKRKVDDGKTRNPMNILVFFNFVKFLVKTPEIDPAFQIILGKMSLNSSKVKVNTLKCNPRGLLRGEV